MKTIINFYVKAGFLALISLASPLVGCSGLPDTDDQVLTIETAPAVESAHCLVANSRSSWEVWFTPSTMSIIRDDKPLVVTCTAPGYHGSLYVQSHHNVTAAFTGENSDVIAETSDATPPDAPYKGNTSGKFNGIPTLYPGTIIVPMIADPYQ